jgi:hypothetical protein
MSKLAYYGIDSNINKWLTSYMTSRRQRVVTKSQRTYENFHLNWGEVQYGVLQGFTLRSLPFLFYINDFPPNINSVSVPILFANDTSIIITEPDISSLAEISNQIFTVMNKWLIANKLTYSWYF